MTVSTEQQRRHVSAEGFANPLNLPANAEDESHVWVFADDVRLSYGTDYTLAGVGDTGDLDEIAGVDATLEDDVLLAGYASYTIEHHPPMDQEVDLSSGGTLGRIYEKGLDYLARRLQALAARIERRVVLPVDAVFDPTLPYPVPRRAIIFNEAGTGFSTSYEDPDSTSAVDANNAAERAEEAEAAAALMLIEMTSLRDQTVNAKNAAEAAAAAAGDPEAIAAMGVPVGATVLFAHASYPASAFLKENGAVISQAAYPELFAAIGSAFNTGGEGAGNFRLPESRGEFFRAWDDGRGVDSGRVLAAAQAEMIGPHDHVAVVGNAGAHSHNTTLTLNSRRGANGEVGGANWSSGDTYTGTYSGVWASTTNGDHSHTVTINANSGTENRPRNVARLAAIKYAVYEPPED